MCFPGGTPDILQFAPANVISLEDCQQDWSFMEEQHICIRDPNGEQGICGVSGFRSTKTIERVFFEIIEVDIIVRSTLAA